MGFIFKDLGDDQQEAMMDTMYVGQTWQFRYLKVKYLVITIVAVTIAVITTASIDYLINKSTDYSGIIGWLLS
mgnify:CR=1 FL=1|jgi:hypothetical protein|tara:strand:- start:42 stop:260 length:219 start_codon:yes stop_codon:yes gene_type:complete